MTCLCGLLVLDLGCCGVAVWQLGAPGRGLPGLDGAACDLRPEQAGVLIVAGRVTPRLAPLLRDLYGRLASPRWVVACGTCAISGAVFDTLPLAEVIPVDVCVAGCPPPGEAILRASIPGRRQER